MKQKLTVQGRVELTTQEITEAIVDFVSTEKKIVQAIEAWLLSKHDLTSVRVRYSKNENGISSAVAEIQGVISDGGDVTKFNDDPKVKRHQPSGFIRRNIGVFKFIREYLADETKKGKKKISFDEMNEQVKFSFPNMSDEKLNVYLYDKRMLPNVKFNKPKNEIQFV